MTAPYRPLSLKQMEDLNIPEPEWLVDGLIVEGTLVLLSAREKSGKGLLTVDLVASIAEGSDFLKRNTMQGPAIYCATEESIQEVRSRFLARVGDNTDLPIHVLSLDGTLNDPLDIMNDECLERLEGMISDLEPRLVVIDVLREIHKGKEDSSDDMAPVMSRLRAIVRRTGTTIVVNHHMGKKGQARGSTWIAAGVDSVLDLEANDGNGAALGGRLEAKGRSVRRTALNITFGENGRWVAANGGPTSRTAPATARQQIHDYLGSTDTPQEAKEIATALGLPEKNRPERTLEPSSGVSRDQKSVRKARGCASLQPSSAAIKPISVSTRLATPSNDIE